MKGEPSQFSKDFWGVIRFFGPLAALQVAAIVIPALLFHQSRSLVAVAQLAAVLTVTMIATGAAFNAGKREGASPEASPPDASSPNHS